MKLKKVLKVLGIILGLLIVFWLVVFGQGEFFYGEMNPSTKTTITNIEEFSLSGQEVLIVSVGEKFKQI